VEGYTPPRDARTQVLNVTPDPGVIEVNVHPAASWRELMATARRSTRKRACAPGHREIHARRPPHRHRRRQSRDAGRRDAGRQPAAARPDLLRSLITYWQNHPALSYLFSGMFIGPTSQAPRVDEARDDRLYELAIAFQQLRRSAGRQETLQPWLVDRLLRNLLTDLTGNTHRTEFSIDKLYSPDTPTGRLGLLEFRAFEMPPHFQMSALQMVLLRALVARFWRDPYGGSLVAWGTALHDRWLLPHYVAADIRDVAHDLARSGYPFEPAWFEPFVEFRFPRYGTVTYDGVTMELRQAIEPWHVLGEEVSGTGTARYVDSSIERLQVKVTGMIGGRHAVTCNGRRCRSRRRAFRESTSRACGTARGIRHRRCIRPSACTRRSRSTSSIRGAACARRLHVSRRASRAAATTTRSPSTRTRRRRAAWRGSGRTATPPDRCRCIPSHPTRQRR
jgi:uncharacterized protein (DUF2126 family)